VRLDRRHLIRTDRRVSPPHIRALSFRERSPQLHLSHSHFLELTGRASIYLSVHWTIYRSWAELTGLPIPSQIPAPTATAVVAAQSANMTVTAQLRSAFTVYENQRWWMGLNWTATLLPGERPSWCNASQAPLPPPVTFALPAPMMAFLSVDGVPDVREQRTAMWAWAEPEWHVVVRRTSRPMPRVRHDTTL